MAINRKGNTMFEAAYNTALGNIAMGATKAETWNDLKDSYRSLSDSEVREAMSDALSDCRKQGVEREDIDDSWF
jgi:hypothetical protein